MENKLTLEHLAIAFANNQKVLYFDDERELNQICKIVELREDEMTILNGEYQYDVSFDDVKLIARPMNYFYKEINVEDGLIIPNDFLMEKIGDTSCITNTMLVGSFTKYGFVKKLIKWHFDIHGLIEKGLAVDINKLKE